MADHWQGRTLTASDPTTSRPAPLSEPLLLDRGEQGSEAATSQRENPVASEQVLDIPVRRHVLTSEGPFQVVLDGIYGGIEPAGHRGAVRHAGGCIPPMRSSPRWSGTRGAALA